MTSPLDPAEYTVVPHVAGLDTFRWSNRDGTFIADITEEFLDRLIDHMNEREAQTGDLAPLVIGHTETGEREVDAPPVVGYARHWHKDMLGNTGRPAAFFDAWIRNECVEEAKRYPRRSCEVYIDRYEVDPVSLLGATTPARDLGLMKLSRNGSVAVESPGEMNMPEEKKKDAPAADPKETGKAKGDDGKLDQILSMLSELLAKIGGAPAPEGAPEAAPEGAPGEPQMSDEEFEKLLSGMGGGEETGRPKGEEPEKMSAGYPGGDNTHVAKMQREVDELKMKLARNEIGAALRSIAARKDINPDDAELVNDLVAMPEDMRARQLSRIERDAKPKLGQTSNLDSAIANATETGKRMTPADKAHVIKLAREKNQKFEVVAREQGFSL